MDVLLLRLSLLRVPTSRSLV